MSAVISPCGQYRYELSRPTSIATPITDSLLIVMLNPSTADAEIDDPTVRRCIRFARDFGAQEIDVCNLYALRATNPKALKTHPDPVGPDNDAHLQRMADLHTNVLCAWGGKAPENRVREFVEMFWRKANLLCLGTTKSGAPRHPLYVRADQPLVPWNFHVYRDIR